jgi:hypothetical protein
LHGRFCVGNGTIANDQAIYVFMYSITQDPSGNDVAVGYDRIPAMKDQTLPQSLPAANAPFSETIPGIQLLAMIPVTYPGNCLDWSALIQNPPPKFGLLVRNNCGAPLSGASVTWAASTSYVRGTIVTPATPNGHLYICVTAGTSNSTAPTWTTTGGMVADGGAIYWLDMGATSTVANWIYWQGEYDQLV